MTPGDSIPTLVHAGDRTYQVVGDRVSRYGALIRGKVVDAVTGDPVRGFRVQADPGAGLRVRNPEDGLFALAGIPERIFPGGVGRTIHLTVAAPGYRTGTRKVQVSSGASFPVTTSPIAIAPVPVTVQGAVVKSATDNARQSGETVLLTGPGGARDTLGLGAPFNEAHAASSPAAPAPAARVRGGTLAMSGLPAKLTKAVDAGASAVAVDDRGLLTWAGPAPRLLALGAQRELAIVAQSGTGQGLVTLSRPLGRSFSAGTTVRAASFTALTGAGASAAAPELAVDAEPGVSIVRLEQGLAPSATAVAVPDGAPTQYATVGSATDANGYYVFPGVAGVRAVELVVEGSAVAAEPLTVDYSRPVNVMDLRKL